VATVGRSDTVRLNEVDRDTPPSLPVTFIGNVPLGVEPLVLIVRVDEQLGLQEILENAEVAPLGNPETENAIGLLLPDFSAAVIKFCAEAPLLAALLPVFESEKSNDCVKANHALASVLSAAFCLKALAFTIVSAVTVIGALYTFEDWVGEVPSIV
jgi:hypothetical protein